SLGVTYRVLTRSAEASASERLGHAVVEVAETAATSIEGRLAELRTLAADPRIRALLAAGTAEGEAAEAAGRALREHAGEASGTALEVRASDGRRLAAIGPDLPVRPSAPTDL